MRHLVDVSRKRKTTCLQILFSRWQEQEALIDALMSKNRPVEGDFLPHVCEVEFNDLKQILDKNTTISVFMNPAFLVSDDEISSLRESEEKLKTQQTEASRRENVLVMRLTAKEQEMQDYVVMLHLTCV